MLVFQRRQASLVKFLAVDYAVGACYIAGVRVFLLVQCSEWFRGPPTFLSPGVK